MHPMTINDENEHVVAGNCNAQTVGDAGAVRGVDMANLVDLTRHVLPLMVNNENEHLSVTCKTQYAGLAETKQDLERTKFYYPCVLPITISDENECLIASSCN